MEIMRIKKTLIEKLNALNFLMVQKNTIIIVYKLF
jgi:hypothetical protein